MKTTTKWRRVRPGLYRLVDSTGNYSAWIERGAETGLWWWEAWDEDGTLSAGNRMTLVVAKACAEGATR
jgi:hypothetical protein